MQRSNLYTEFFFVSGKGRMSRVSGSYALCPPSSLASKGGIKDYYYCTFVLWDIYLTRHSEFRRCRLPCGMMAFNSCRGQTSAHSFFVSRSGWIRVSGPYTLPGVCSTRRAVLYFNAPVVCKGDQEAFSISFVHR